MIFLTKLRVEAIDSKYVRLTKPFVFVSRVLKDNGYGGMVIMPVGFTFDYESIPRIPIVYLLLAHTSKRGGAVHDYLYRKDSIPIVTRKIADQVYLEIMIERKNAKWRRWLKYYGVRIFSRWSFHKIKVAASYEKIKGDKL